jgi:plasmid stabilization system protein ParE
MPSCAKPLRGVLHKGETLTSLIETTARDDLLRRFDFLLMRAETIEDFDTTQLAVDAVRTQVEDHLGSTPLVFRKAGQNPFVRELVIPFGSTGYVALYEVVGQREVHVLAVRHQRKGDYH